MGRTFSVAVLAGGLLTLIGLASIRLGELPEHPPVLARTADGASSEQWFVEADDLLAVTGDTPVRLPAKIARPVDARLEGLTVATMKVRSSRGEVIGVASRIAAAERTDGPRATWWTFVLGRRGTLAAYLPDERDPQAGELLGGTRSFEGAAGRFAEEVRAGGGYVLKIVRPEA